MEEERDATVKLPDEELPTNQEGNKLHCVLLLNGKPLTQCAA